MTLDFKVISELFPVWVSLTVGLSLLAVGGLLIAVLILWHALGFSPILRTRVTLCSKMKVSSLQDRCLKNLETLRIEEFTQLYKVLLFDTVQL